MRSVWWFVLTVVTVALAVSGCPTGSCSESNCDGCCAGTECVSGRSRYTCGSGGLACVECSATNLCSAGQCVPDPRLDPDSGMLLCSCASGCCTADGGCAPGTQIEACGETRTTCAVCEPTARCEQFTCHSEACAGCIDASNVCRTGDTSMACGTGGMLCLGCLPGQRCADGACVDAPCNSSTCAGGCCNLAQQCVTSPSDSNCGLGGRVCASCVNGLHCNQGLCQ